MTKLDAMKIIKDIMCGNSKYTYGNVYKVGKSWNVEVGKTKEIGEGWHFQHCCNGITIKEVSELLAQNNCLIE